MKSDNKNAKNKKPWPTKKAMQQVYQERLWGSGASEFYSGEGSHLPEIVEPYVKTVIDFLSQFNKNISVCDLGCGDFNIGKELVSYTKKYIAVDIVPELILRNQNLFQIPNLEFQCLDIAKDDLPIADCAIIRQVLQHLSNAEVLQITRKLKQYKYIIVTEHLPSDEFIANVDIISGQGTRLKKKSGIQLLQPPFNLKIVEEKELLKVTDQHGVIVTNLYRLS
ncbi:Methyltransferase domain-containing protein [Maribacter litoralis]|uniref:Methyltransferase domain-containing protein n=2 Tax=Maribacter litoralis TaxID=2059726 RepID=A0A653PG58_9FLAO|nr:Methyltransferase domain-containing protein [Maribacter litoralis]